jgi:hypothetical protein
MKNKNCCPVALILIHFIDLLNQNTTRIPKILQFKIINKNLKINVNMFKSKELENCQISLFQKSIKSWSSSDSLESEYSDSSSSSACNVNVVWADGAGGVVSLLFGVV